MRPFITYKLFCSLGLLAFSCGSKDEEQIPAAQQYISHFYLKTTEDNNYTQQAWEFMYDANKRVTTLNIRDFSHNFSYIYGYMPVGKFDFDYKPGETQPYRTRIERNLTTPAINEIWHQYDQQGRKIADSMVTTDTDKSWTKITYRYEGGYVIWQQIIPAGALNSPVQSEQTDTLWVNNNNTIKATSTGREGTWISSIMTVNYTSDNRHNPFYGLSISNAFFLMGNNLLSGKTFQGLNKNNVLSITDKYNSFPANTYPPYVFTYNNDGYPVKRESSLGRYAIYEYLP